MIASLPEELAGKVRNDEDLLGVYCGVFPEVGGRSGSLLTRRSLALEQTAILIEAINSNGWAKVIMHAHLGYSVVNLKAVARVIRDNQEYFPQEALSDPVSWLSDNSPQWFLGAMTDIKEIRYGLLSGFPLNACIKEGAYNQVRRRLINNVLPGETMEDIIFLNNFVMYGRSVDSYSSEELARFIVAPENWTINRG